MTEKRKLLWVGDDYRIKTGYGRVANHLFSNLDNDFTICHYAIGCQGVSKKYHVIDSNDGTPFGFNKIANVINVVKPDIVILLNDAKIIYGWLLALKDKLTHQCCLIPYVCTEYIGVPSQDIELYNQMSHAIMTMANFTIKEFVSQGYQHKTFRLSHGYPETIPKMDKVLCKRRLYIDPETFVFFSGSKNQPRKRLDIIIRAFVHFLKRHSHEKVMLMMNCGMVDSGWDIKQLYERLCRENNILDCEKYIYYCSDQLGDSNKNDNQLATIYNASDVGITTSTGESFGLIPFEQSKLGVPQIIPNWGGIIEAVPHGTIKITPNDYYVYPVSLQVGNGEARTVYYQDVTEAMHKYYTDKDFYQTHCQEVTKNIEGYSWKEVADQFLQIVNQVSPPSLEIFTSIPDVKISSFDDGNTDNVTVNKYILSFTTIPSRLTQIEQTIISLMNQTLKPEKIILNIPKTYNLRFKSTYDENTINMIKEKYRSHLVINIIDHDYGPGTKLLGLINSNLLDLYSKDTYIVLVDDDLIYNPNLLQYFDDLNKKDYDNKITAASFYCYNLKGIQIGQGADGFFIKLETLNQFSYYYNIIKDYDYVNYHDDYYISYYFYLKQIQILYMRPYFPNINIYQHNQSTYINALFLLKDEYSRENLNNKLNEILSKLDREGRFENIKNNDFYTNKKKIPKIIHQIWIDDKPPPYQYLNTWKNAHPDWTYYLWDNESVARETFTNQVLIDTYPAIVSKVDLIRYELLYKYGGIYIDADIICLKPLDDHFLQHDFFATYYNSTTCEQDTIIGKGKLFITPSTFGTPPDSEILATLIQNFHQTIPLKLHQKISDPVTLTCVPFHELLTTTKLSHYIYPNHYFNPQDFLDLEQTTAINRDEMYGLHLWGTTRSNMTNGEVNLYSERLVNIPIDGFDFNICIYPDQEKDLISESLKNEQIWEPEITQKLVDILKNSPKDQLFVDVGANLGYYSLLAASLGFTCYSFEPFSKNYDKFTSSIKLNSLYSKIILAKKIVWNEDGLKKSMEIVPGPITNYGCIKVANEHTSSETCLTCTLDTTIPSGKKIVVLKIDVEGSEPEVIWGCQQLISQNLVENIFMEISPKFRSKQQYLDIVGFLIGHSYRIYDFKGQQYSFEEMVFDIPETQKDYLFVKDHFIPIISINLKSQVDRRTHLIQQLKDHNLTYDNILIDAIDGEQIQFDQQSYISQQAVTTILSPDNEHGHGHDMTKGGLGLIATSVNIWSILKKPCLILEDDVQLEYNFHTQLGKYLSQLPDNWDLFYLGYYHDPRLSQHSENIFSANKVYGLFGYLINPTSISKILKRVLPCDYQLDTEIHRRCKDLKTYVAYPPLIHHSGKFPSSIQIYDT